MQDLWDGIQAVAEIFGILHTFIPYVFEDGLNVARNFLTQSEPVDVEHANCLPQCPLLVPSSVYAYVKHWSALPRRSE